MLDHLSIQCADVPRARPSTTPCSGTLGGRADHGLRPGHRLRAGRQARFWIGPQATGDGFRESHIAFAAPDRPAVRAFFDAAVSCGAEVLHAPRLWPEYHPNYYGAFVRDPDGNNVEAVCHLPE